MDYDYVGEKIRSIHQIRQQTRTNVGRRIWELQQQVKSELDGGTITQADYDRIIAASNGEVNKI